MRKLFSFNMVTLDGYFEGPNHEIDWHHIDGEFNKFAIQQTASCGTLIFGRVTYEMMASYWPTPMAIKDDPEVAGLMNSLQKIVASKTLKKAEWNNTRLINDQVGDEIRNLKEQPGKDLAIFGSANLLSTLIELGLVDEHRVMVNPIILGDGFPLFTSLKGQQNLRLISTRTFGNGNVLLSYQPDGKG